MQPRPQEPSASIIVCTLIPAGKLSMQREVVAVGPSKRTSYSSFSSLSLLSRPLQVSQCLCTGKMMLSRHIADHCSLLAAQLGQLLEMQ